MRPVAWARTLGRLVGLRLGAPDGATPSSGGTPPPRAPRGPLLLLLCFAAGLVAGRLFLRPPHAAPPDPAAGASLAAAARALSRARIVLETRSASVATSPQPGPDRGVATPPGGRRGHAPLPAGANNGANDRPAGGGKSPDGAPSPDETEVERRSALWAAEGFDPVRAGLAIAFDFEAEGRLLARLEDCRGCEVRLDLAEAETGVLREAVRAAPPARDNGRRRWSCALGATLAVSAVDGEPVYGGGVTCGWRLW